MKSFRIGIPWMICWFVWLLKPSLVQAESDPDCGAKCLYTACVSLDIDPGTYRDYLNTIGPINSRGLSLGRLAELAEEQGLSTLVLETSLENLRRRREEPPFACIAHVDGDHFVLIGDVQPEKVWVVDPPAEQEVAAAVFEQRWRGHALLLARHPLRTDAELPQSNQVWPLSLLLATGVGGAGLILFLWRRQRS
jgi:ABC-type bacteriocin/lantibiotic exporter with double-glycine peptidase domain